MCIGVNLNVQCQKTDVLSNAVSVVAHEAIAVVADKDVAAVGRELFVLLYDILVRDID